MKIYNDLDLETDIRRLLNYAGKVDSLLRERQVGNLDDALFIMQIAAKDARRRLRKIARERV